MFSDYSWADLGAIFAMQGFVGLTLFAVFVLMALGWAIIFGQMGVINLAHGEFMILGAYVTYLVPDEGRGGQARCLALEPARAGERQDQAASALS
jgi:branched-subunit amino acid ABC-type transport system permease component